MAWTKQKKSGHVRTKKGGYPRAIYIELWMEARQSDNTAPVSELKTREEVQNPKNLVVCCRECNIEKGNKYSYEEFLKIKTENE